jgi:hemolysin activation/secretion protein
MMVGTIHVVGSTVFAPEELDKVKAPYENRELSTEDLEELRRAFTLLYTNNGYVNSGAIIPDQTVQEDEITFQIIEGKLTDINIEGTKNFLPFYFEQRIALSAGPP